MTEEPTAPDTSVGDGTTPVQTAESAPANVEYAEEVAVILAAFTEVFQTLGKHAPAISQHFDRLSSPESDDEFYHAERTGSQAFLRDFFIRLRSKLEMTLRKLDLEHNGDPKLYGPLPIKDTLCGLEIMEPPVVVTGDTWSPEFGLINLLARFERNLALLPDALPPFIDWNRSYAKKRRRPNHFESIVAPVSAQASAAVDCKAPLPPLAPWETH